MKYFFFIASVLLLFIRCSSEKAEQIHFDLVIDDKPESYDTLMSPDQPRDVLDTFNFEGMISDAIQLDSVEYLDSVKGIYYKIVFPETSSITVNQRIRRDSKFFKKEFLKDVEENLREDTIFPNVGSSFDVRVVGAFENDSIISIALSYYQYVSPSVHGYLEYKVYNYDKRRRRFVKFNEILKMESEDDWSSFETLIVDRLPYIDQSVMSLAELKVNIYQDTFFMNFNNYEICSYAGGAPRIPLRRSDLKAWAKF